MKRISEAEMKDSQKHGKTAIRKHISARTKQEVSTQGPKENQETGLREQVDKQKYADTSGETTVYTDYQERPLEIKGRNVDSTILRYVRDS